jgi:MFS family permease
MKDSNAINTPSISAELAAANKKKLWWIVLMMGSFFGLCSGLARYTWGPYLYELFGGTLDPGHAIFLAMSIQVIFSVANTLLEMPMGAIADTIGRSYAVMLSWGCRVLSYSLLSLVFLFRGSHWAFLIGITYIIAYTISYTLFNGSFTAWLADWMKENTPEMNYATSASNFQAYSSAAEIIGAIISVLCYSYNFAFFAYALAGFFAFITMIFCMNKLEEVTNLTFLNPRKLAGMDVFKRIGEIFIKGCQLSVGSKIIFWILMTYGSYLFLLNMVAYLWPIHLTVQWGARHFTWQWMALVIIPLTLSTCASRYLAHTSKKWKAAEDKPITMLRRMFAFLGFLCSGTIFTISIATYLGNDSFVLFSICVSIMILSYGIMTATFETLINYYIPATDAQERATILSAGSMIRGLLMLVFAIPTGGTGGQSTPVYWSIPAILLFFSTFITIVIMMRCKSSKAIIETVEIA